MAASGFSDAVRAECHAEASGMIVTLYGTSPLDEVEIASLKLTLAGLPVQFQWN